MFLKLPHKHSEEGNILVRKFYVVNAFIGLLCLGMIYAWSVFVRPLEADFGWTRSETSLNFSICVTTLCIGGLASGRLMNTKTPRQIMIFSAASIMTGFIFVSRMQTLFELYFFYGVLCGLGIGVGYNALISTTLQWYPERQGLISGLLLMAFGMGGSLGNVTHYMMNAMGWRNTFAVLGLILGGLIFLVSLNVKRPAAGQIYRNSASGNEMNFKPSEMLRDRSFYANYIRGLTTGAAGLAMMGSAVPFAYSVSRDATFAAAIGGVVYLFNGLGRVIGGAIFDKIGSRKTFLFGVGGISLAVIILILAATSDSVILLTAGYIGGGFFYGYNVVSGASLIGKIYGLRDFAANISISNTYILFSSFLGPYISGVLFTRTGSYVFSYTVLLGMCCVSFLASESIKKHYVPQVTF